MFGREAPSPLHVLVEDWSANKFIAHASDLVGPQSHPEVGPEIVRQPIWQGRLVFGAAETSRQSPGLIDGALFAAETAVQSLLLGVGEREAASMPGGPTKPSTQHR